MTSKVTAITQEKLFFAVLSSLCLVIPFFLSQNQLLTGTIVNACLFFSSKFKTKKYQLPLIFLPSLATLSRGLIFGSLTSFLIVFLPFIWLGNYLLILTYEKKGNIFFSAFSKYLLLYLTARLFFSFGLVPRLFLSSMGLYQLITALLGGLIFWLLQKKITGHE